MLSSAASLALVLALPSVLSLRCFQGQQKASSPVEGAPLECLANSQSCGRTYDPLTKTVTRFCQISNCTKNGVVSDHAVCSDNFGKNNGTEEEECCCYGDGCNEKSVDEPLKDLADGEWYASIPPLRCYQFFRNASIPLNGVAPTLCEPGARACSEQFNWVRSQVVHSCLFEPCRDAKREPTSARVCRNETVGPYDVEACCCSTDGCNKRLGNPRNTKPERQTLASRIAERIERFYDKDAASSERTFIRRVVNHVHENIDQS